jgi:hypothetical protein
MESVGLSLNASYKINISQLLIYLKYLTRIWLVKTFDLLWDSKNISQS